MEKLYAMIIFMMPLLFLVKGGYYMYISNALTDKRRDRIMRKYSGIKLETPLDFYEKNRYVAKVYFSVGSVIMVFITILNICYSSFTPQRIVLMIIGLFFIDLILEQLAIIKCKLTDYDTNQENKSVVSEGDKTNDI